MKSKLTYTFTFQLVIHVVQKCYDGEQETPWEQLQAFLHYMPICLENMAYVLLPFPD